MSNETKRTFKDALSEIGLNTDDNLEGLDMRKINLKNVDASVGVLSENSLKGVDFSGTDMRGVQLCEQNLRFCRFHKY